MMKRVLPIFATLAFASLALAQAPVVSGTPTPADSPDGPLAPIVDVPTPAAPKAALPNTAPSPVPMPVAPMQQRGCATGSCGDMVASNCAGGCVGGCQGNCSGDGVLNCLTGCGSHPPNCPCPVCFPKRMWFSGAYMHTYAKSRFVPPLVTTSPDATPRDQAGVLPGATILFGGESEGGNLQPGMRFELGRWLGEGHVGVAARVFYTENDSDGFQMDSGGGTLPIIALPFFDPVANQQDAILLAHPDVATDGRVSINHDMEAISTEALLRFKVARSNGIHLDILGGYHHIRLDDSLLLQAHTEDIDNTNFVINGTTFDITDSFSTENKFNGGSFGMDLKILQNRFTLRGLAKLSIGSINQQLTIDGQQIITLPPIAGGGVSTIDSGIYTQPSNIGTMSRQRTTFIPEAALTLGYRVNRCLELNVGYSMLYLTNIALAGNHIDTTVDFNQPPPSADGPLATLNDSSLWLQGVTIGGSWNF